MKWEGGKPPRRLTGTRISYRSLLSAVRSPRAAVGLATRTVLSAVGLAAFAPLIGMFLPLIITAVQKAIKDYFDAEIKRRLEEERRKIISEVYATLNAEDRALLRESVPG